jgi:hypothetical protein
VGAEAKTAFAFAIGDDLAIVLDKRLPLAERAIAAAALASNFVGPGGSLTERGAMKLARVVAEHALEHVAANALQELRADLDGPIRTNSDRGRALADRLEHRIDRAEALLGDLHLRPSVEAKIERRLEEARKTIEDTVTAIDAAPGDRGRAWGHVAIDVAAAAARGKAHDVADVATRGQAHAAAAAWNGTAQWEGRVTAVSANGGFEIATGRESYVAFDASQAKALGVDPRGLEVGAYIGITRELGDARQPLRADVASDAKSLPSRAEQRSAGIGE